MKMKNVSEHPKDAGVTIVTGGGSGIGAAIVCGLLSRGRPVLVVDQSIPSAGLDIPSASAPVFSIEEDVADPDAAKKVVAEALRVAGRIEGLVNNAGIINQDVPSLDLPIDNWQRVLDVNLRGTFAMSQAVGNAMMSAGGGSIVNMASTAGLGGFVRRSAYGPSKAAIINLTSALAVEWGPLGIRVNAVAPGYVRTSGLDAAISARYLDEASLVHRTPLGRLGREDDVFQAVEFLLSPQSSFITGTTLAVDGGWSAQLNA
jgi:NAD(P)-dependent dehydrogenase (short-subunit alcohol dehydrogenase family)